GGNRSAHVMGDISPDLKTFFRVSLETYELEQSMPVSDWLDIQLDMAEQWGWAAPEKLLFLITQRLKEEKGKIIQDWLPLQGEAPQLHFDRLYKEAEYWCDAKLQ
ncbi:hypothetical protein QN380_21135, partial [Pseudomonas sp. MH10]|nr:hypothetical protein [Pseudomonas sp. MH10]